MVTAEDDEDSDNDRLYIDENPTEPVDEASGSTQSIPHSSTSPNLQKNSTEAMIFTEDTVVTENPINYLPLMSPENVRNIPRYFPHKKDQDQSKPRIACKDFSRKPFDTKAAKAPYLYYQLTNDTQHDQSTAPNILIPEEQLSPHNLGLKQLLRAPMRPPKINPNRPDQTFMTLQGKNNPMIPSVTNEDPNGQAQTLNKAIRKTSVIMTHPGYTSGGTMTYKRPKPDQQAQQAMHVNSADQKQANSPGVTNIDPVPNGPLPPSKEAFVKQTYSQLTITEFYRDRIMNYDQGTLPYKTCQPGCECRKGQILNSPSIPQPNGGLGHMASLSPLQTIIPPFHPAIGNSPTNMPTLDPQHFPMNTFINHQQHTVNPSLSPQATVIEGAPINMPPLEPQHPMNPFVNPLLQSRNPLSPERRSINEFRNAQNHLMELRLHRRYNSMNTSLNSPIKMMNPPSNSQYTSRRGINKASVTKRRSITKRGRPKNMPVLDTQHYLGSQHQSVNPSSSSEHQLNVQPHKAVMPMDIPPVNPPHLATSFPRNSQHQAMVPPMNPQTMSHAISPQRQAIIPQNFQPQAIHPKHQAMSPLVNPQHQAMSSAVIVQHQIINIQHQNMSPPINPQHQSGIPQNIQQQAINPAHPTISPPVNLQHQVMNPSENPQAMSSIISQHRAIQLQHQHQDMSSTMKGTLIPNQIIPSCNEPIQKRKPSPCWSCSMGMPCDGECGLALSPNVQAEVPKPSSTSSFNYHRPVQENLFYRGDEIYKAAYLAATRQANLQAKTSVMNAVVPVNQTVNTKANQKAEYVALNDNANIAGSTGSGLYNPDIPYITPTRLNHITKENTVTRKQIVETTTYTKISMTNITQAENIPSSATETNSPKINNIAMPAIELPPETSGIIQVPLTTELAKPKSDINIETTDAGATTTAFCMNKINLDEEKDKSNPKSTSVDSNTTLTHLVEDKPSDVNKVPINTEQKKAVQVKIDTIQRSMTNNTQAESIPSSKTQKKSPKMTNIEVPHSGLTSETPNIMQVPLKTAPSSPIKDIELEITQTNPTTIAFNMNNIKREEENDEPKPTSMSIDNNEGLTHLVEKTTYSTNLAPINIEQAWKEAVKTATNIEMPHTDLTPETSDIMQIPLKTEPASPTHDTTIEASQIDAPTIALKMNSINLEEQKNKYKPTSTSINSNASITHLIDDIPSDINVDPINIEQPRKDPVKKETNTTNIEMPHIGWTPGTRDIRQDPSKTEPASPTKDIGLETTQTDAATIAVNNKTIKLEEENAKLKPTITSIDNNNTASNHIVEVEPSAINEPQNNIKQQWKEPVKTTTNITNIEMTHIDLISETSDVIEVPLNTDPTEPTDHKEIDTTQTDAPTKLNINNEKVEEEKEKSKAITTSIDDNTALTLLEDTSETARTDLTRTAHNKIILNLLNAPLSKEDKSKPTTTNIDTKDVNESPINTEQPCKQAVKTTTNTTKISLASNTQAKNITSSETQTNLPEMNNIDIPHIDLTCILSASSDDKMQVINAEASKHLKVETNDNNTITLFQAPVNTEEMSKSITIIIDDIAALTHLRDTQSYINEAPMNTEPPLIDITNDENLIPLLMDEEDKSIKNYVEMATQTRALQISTENFQSEAYSSTEQPSKYIDGESTLTLLHEDSDVQTNLTLTSKPIVQSTSPFTVVSTTSVTTESTSHDIQNDHIVFRPETFHGKEINAEGFLTGSQTIEPTVTVEVVNKMISNPKISLPPKEILQDILNKALAIQAPYKNNHQSDRTPINCHKDVDTKKEYINTGEIMGLTNKTTSNNITVSNGYATNNIGYQTMKLTNSKDDDKLRIAREKLAKLRILERERENKPTGCNALTDSVTADLDGAKISRVRTCSNDGSLDKLEDLHKDHCTGTEAQAVNASQTSKDNIILPKREISNEIDRNQPQEDTNKTCDVSKPRISEITFGKFQIYFFRLVQDRLSENNFEKLANKLATDIHKFIDRTEDKADFEYECHLCHNVANFLPRQIYNRSNYLENDKDDAQSCERCITFRKKYIDILMKYIQVVTSRGIDDTKYVESITEYAENNVIREDTTTVGINEYETNSDTQLHNNDNVSKKKQQNNNNIEKQCNLVRNTAQITEIRLKTENNQNTQYAENNVIREDATAGGNNDCQTNSDTPLHKNDSLSTNRQKKNNNVEKQPSLITDGSQKTKFHIDKQEKVNTIKTHDFIVKIPRHMLKASTFEALEQRKNSNPKNDKLEKEGENLKTVLHDKCNTSLNHHGGKTSKETDNTDTNTVRVDCTTNVTISQGNDNVQNKESHSMSNKITKLQHNIDGCDKNQERQLKKRKSISDEIESNQNLATRHSRTVINNTVTNDACQKKYAKKRKSISSNTLFSTNTENKTKVSDNKKENKRQSLKRKSISAENELVINLNSQKNITITASDDINIIANEMAKKNDFKKRKCSTIVSSKTQIRHSNITLDENSKKPKKTNTENATNGNQENENTTKSNVQNLDSHSIKRNSICNEIGIKIGPRLQEINIFSAKDKETNHVTKKSTSKDIHACNNDTATKYDKEDITRSTAGTITSPETQIRDSNIIEVKKQDKLSKKLKRMNAENATNSNQESQNKNTTIESQNSVQNLDIHPKKRKRISSETADNTSPLSQNINTNSTYNKEKSKKNNQNVRKSTGYEVTKQNCSNNTAVKYDNEDIATKPSVQRSISTETAIVKNLEPLKIAIIRIPNKGSDTKINSDTSNQNINYANTNTEKNKEVLTSINKTPTTKRFKVASIYNKDGDKNVTQKSESRKIAVKTKPNSQAKEIKTKNLKKTDHDEKDNKLSKKYNEIMNNTDTGKTTDEDNDKIGNDVGIAALKDCIKSLKENGHSIENNEFLGTLYKTLKDKLESDEDEVPKQRPITKTIGVLSYRYICSYCSVSFISPTFCKAHVVKDHQKINVVSEDYTEMIKCSYCSHFVMPKLYNSHVKTRHKDIYSKRVKDKQST